MGNYLPWKAEHSVLVRDGQGDTGCTAGCRSGRVCTLHWFYSCQ